jgi:EAL domain-containing protein (putative c-di-GMP-specific phosphodiesterase class I)
LSPYTIDGHDLHVTASIGISIFPDHGQDAESLIKCADTAMYCAKDHGRNNYQFFVQDMNVRAVERQSLEGALRRALPRHELIVHYQPQMNLTTGVVAGAEALVRWLHPVRGTVYPEQFVSIAEDCGLIVPIGQWVLREACRQMQAWLARGLAIDRMAVNISAMEVRHKGFVDGVRRILGDTGLAPHYLELELTETVLMEEAHAIDSVLCELKEMGVQLAVDDFGTGYSSLSYLRRFPIDTLKIDQSFVRDIENRDGTPIVGAVIKLAKSLDKLVVAEGVETATQLAYLREQCCDQGQGYYFSRPIAAAGLATLLGA